MQDLKARYAGALDERDKLKLSVADKEALL